jgi:hypothetical protein
MTESVKMAVFWVIVPCGLVGVAEMLPASITILMEARWIW